MVRKKPPSKQPDQSHIKPSHDGFVHATTPLHRRTSSLAPSGLPAASEKPAMGSSPKCRWHIALELQDLKFSAAHFVAFEAWKKLEEEIRTANALSWAQNHQRISKNIY